MQSTTLKTIVTVGMTVQRKDDQKIGLAMTSVILNVKFLNVGMILEIVTTPVTLIALFPN